MSRKIPDRIDLDKDGWVDDVVISDVSVFRLERMDAGHIWIRAYMGKGRPDHVFSISCTGARIRVDHEED